MLETNMKQALKKCKPLYCSGYSSQDLKMRHLHSAYAESKVHVKCHHSPVQQEQEQEQLTNS